MMVYGDDISENADAEGIREIAASAIRNGMGACAMLVTTEILRITYTPEVMPYIGTKMLDYMAAAGALAFSANDITADGIVELLRTVGVEPRDDYLVALSKLNYKNELVYINAIYFSKANGREPTIDLIAEVVRSMGIAPDHRIAGYTIEYTREYLEGAYNLIGSKLNQGGENERFFKKLYLGMLDMSNSMSELAVRALDDTIEMSAERITLGPRALPYLTAIGSLAFAGRDATVDNVSAMVMALGIEVDKQLIEAFSEVRYRNPIVYLIALYYLYALEVRQDSENVCKVVKALGIEPDPLMADTTLAFYRSKAGIRV